jgi:hypothetical protein
VGGADDVGAPALVDPELNPVSDGLDQESVLFCARGLDSFSSLSSSLTGSAVSGSTGAGSGAGALVSLMTRMLRDDDDRDRDHAQHQGGDGDEQSCTHSGPPS